MNAYGIAKQICHEDDLLSNTHINRRKQNRLRMDIELNKVEYGILKFVIMNNIEESQAYDFLTIIKRLLDKPLEVYMFIVDTVLENKDNRWELLLQNQPEKTKKSGIIWILQILSEYGDDLTKNGITFKLFKYTSFNSLFINPFKNGTPGPKLRGYMDLILKNLVDEPVYINFNDTSGSKFDYCYGEELTHYGDGEEPPLLLVEFYALDVKSINRAIDIYNFLTLKSQNLWR